MPLKKKIIKNLYEKKKSDEVGKIMESRDLSDEVKKSSVLIKKSELDENLRKKIKEI